MASIVQHTEFTDNPTVRTPDPDQVGASFASDNTSGNTILVMIAYESGNISRDLFGSITDTQHNTYDQISLSEAHTDASPGLFVALAKNIAAGPNTVTVNFATQFNGFGHFTTTFWHYAIIAEISGLGTTPTIQDFSAARNYAGDLGSMSITDSHGTVVTLDLTAVHPNLTWLLADILGAGTDFVFACGIGHGIAGADTLVWSSYASALFSSITNTTDVAISANGTYLVFYAAPVAFAVSCASPPDGTVGTSYMHAFPATGGTTPYTFSVLADTLPPGLAIDPATGIVSGIPTASGTFSFVVNALDSGANATSIACSITIGGMTLGCGATPNGQVGVAYEDQLIVSAGVPPYVFTLLSGELPPGLTLNPATGEITGTPTTPGVYCFTVQVTEGAPAPGTGGFVNQRIVTVVHGLNSTSVSPGVWDDSGNVIKFGTVQLTDANTAVLTFPTAQSGSFKLSADTFQQGFVGATSVSVPHGLNSLNLIPVVFDGANNVIDFGTFELVDVNNAVLTFPEAQSGTLIILLPTGTYSQTFAPASSIPVAHNLNSTLLRVAVYDPSDNLIAYESFGPVDANNSVLTFPAGSPQAGRVVVRVP